MAMIWNKTYIHAHNHMSYTHFTYVSLLDDPPIRNLLKGNRLEDS